MDVTKTLSIVYIFTCLLYERSAASFLFNSVFMFVAYFVQVKMHLTQNSIIKILHFI